MSDEIQTPITISGVDTNRISDGYHTFGELYEHRIWLFIALCGWIREAGCGGPSMWKSRIHHDGSELDGWFIAGIGKKAGEQITYHLPDRYWEALAVIELDCAPEWDGHTSNDVIERLKRL